VTPFKQQLMSQQILGRLLKQDVVVNVDLNSDSACNHILYERGRPADCFTLVVEGHIRIHVGSEDFIFDGGPFMYFGVQALTGAVQTTPGKYIAYGVEYTLSSVLFFYLSSTLHYCRF
jgi:CRP-like cAMP-binding protein